MKRNIWANKTPAPYTKTVACIPTYNEAGTIGPLIEALLALPESIDILLIDDGSTDGTQAIIETWRTASSRVALVQRHAKLGIGSAHRLAWKVARERGYDRIVTLDGDLSHQPADVPRLLRALDQGADVAIGSRFAPGGRINYTGTRLFLSRSANYLARSLLGAGLTEYTTSLRAARLARVPPELVASNPHDGYSFFLSCVVTFARAGLSITEIPIHFQNRQSGISKLRRIEILRASMALLSLTVKHRANRPST